MRPKVSKRRDIIKIREEIHKIEKNERGGARMAA